MKPERWQQIDELFLAELESRTSGSLSSIKLVSLQLPYVFSYSRA